MPATPIMPSTMMATLLMSLTVVTAVPGAALAQSEKPGRYSMSPHEGGFVRLDTETGDMAFCKKDQVGAWACEAMPDSQLAMRQDLDRLRRENDSLRRGRTPDASAPPLPPAEGDLAPPDGARRIPIPTEQDVDKLFDYVEGMTKKLKERLKRLEEQNSEKGTPL